MVTEFAPVALKPVVLVDGEFQEENFARLNRMWHQVSELGHTDALAGRPKRTLNGEQADFQADYESAYDDAIECQ